MMLKRIVIIGGGFSGTVAAVHLLKANLAIPLQIIVIDPNEVGRGIAYGTHDTNHLLNVPAGGMSAIPSKPNDFLEFAQRILPKAMGSDFLPRRLYGDYLQWLMQEAFRHKSQHCEFSTIRDTVIDLKELDSGFLIHLAVGQALTADFVLVATGNGNTEGSPASPLSFSDTNGRYIPDPWCVPGVTQVDLQQPVLLIGSSLTAVDVILSLRSQRFDHHIYSISRHGLTPLAHRGLSQKKTEIEIPKCFDGSAPVKISALMHTMRQVANKLVRNEDDWRDLVAAVRVHIPQLWQEQLTDVEKSRFVRHCQAYWNVHRHRIAPVISESLKELIVSNRLSINAGRISSLQKIESGLEVQWLPRGSKHAETLRVGTAINCTGSSGNLKRSCNPLHQSLLRRAVFVQDKFNLGIQTAADYQILTRDNNPLFGLFYVGPLLKARYWEATAVPELRVHAMRAAQELIKRLV